MAWPTFTVDVTQDSNQIKVYGAVPASELPAGFEVIINGFGNLEVSYGTAVMYDGSNNPYSHLYLVRPYSGATATSIEMVVKPTGSQFNDVVGIFQNGSNLLNSTMEGYRQFVEGIDPVTFQPLDENAEPISIKPLLQMNQEAQTAVSEAISAFQNAAGTAAGYDVTESTTDVGNGTNGKPKLLPFGAFGLGKAQGLFAENLDSFTRRGVFSGFNFVGFGSGGWRQATVIKNDADGQGQDQVKQILNYLDSPGTEERVSNDGGGSWSVPVCYLHTGNTPIQQNASRLVLNNIVDNGVDSIQTSGSIMSGLGLNYIGYIDFNEIDVWHDIAQITSIAGVLHARNMRYGGSSLWMLDPNGGVVELANNFLDGVFTIQFSPDGSNKWKIKMVSGGLDNRLGFKIF